MIEVNQDPLGRQAKPLVQDDETLIMAKPMEDGSLAVGLFNLAELPRQMSVDWSLLGLQGKQRVRDLWRQKDLGRFAGSLCRRRPASRSDAGSILAAVEEGNTPAKKRTRHKHRSGHVRRVAVLLPGRPFGVPTVVAAVLQMDCPVPYSDIALEPPQNGQSVCPQWPYRSAGMHPQRQAWPPGVSVIG